MSEAMRDQPASAESIAEAKRLARDTDVAVRRQVAARTDVPPELLYYLAADPVPEVRREVARNPQAPRHADYVLAGDADGEVRSDLAAKIGRLLPGLQPGERERLRKVALRTLDLLARDQLVRVRRILAEAIKDLTDAPRDLVLRLAQDEALEVAAPVLEASPVLTDEDLLEIIANTPESGALAAIARRSAVGIDVADQVAASGDPAAVADLLANHGAQIREETLDRLIEAAPGQTSWHAPLVRRPRLAGGAATRMARFVARSLLGELARRQDLDAAELAAVASVVEQRLAEPVPEAEPEADSDAAHSERATFDPNWGEADSGEEEAARMAADGKLDEEAISEAMASGRRSFVKAALAQLAQVPSETVQRAVSLKNAKGIVALTWKAGLSMRLALQLQMQLASLPPASLIRARRDGSFPLAPKDMEWQIQFLGEAKT